MASSKLLLPIFLMTIAQNDSNNCGEKPIPKIECRIGNCVNGQWQEICEPPPAPTCEMMPLPNFGCRIGRCVNDKWEQICDPNLSCGIKPIPKDGCRIGKCINNEWEEICD